jgi:hypothetical protein
MGPIIGLDSTEKRINPTRRKPYSEMLRRLALARAKRRNIPEDGILLSHRHENLKSYII